jgi:3-methylcrotonyl-CoA carboxylase alpha subunit
VAAAALSIVHEGPRRSLDPHSPWQRRDFWRLGGTASAAFRFAAGDVVHQVRLQDRDRCEVDGQSVEAPRDASILRLGDAFWVVLPDATCRLTYIDQLAPSERSAAIGGKIVAPMPGKISAVLVSPGATVHRGQTLMVIEAMKMEHAIAAPDDGVIEAIDFAPGALVEEGVELLRMKASP